jgi:hypothetical protein
MATGRFIWYDYELYTSPDNIKCTNVACGREAPARRREALADPAAQPLSGEEVRHRQQTKNKTDNEKRQKVAELENQFWQY